MQFVPWQESPNQRGTIDIVWSCMATVFVCVWACVHLNVPAVPEVDTTFKLWGRRLKWVWNCTIVPEVVLLLAAGQLAEAQDCQREMQAILKEQEDSHQLENGDAEEVKSPQRPVVRLTGSTIDDSTHILKEIETSRPKLRRSETFEQRQKRHKDERWTLRHAFFANMGGWRLQDSTGKFYIINGKHINHLVRQRYILLPDVTTLQINDQSKSDSLAKFLAVLQITWLAIQVIARVAQGLESTSLEVTTLSFVVCTLGTFAAWYRKPYDVQTFRILHMRDHSVEDIDLKYIIEEDMEHDLLQEYLGKHKTKRHEIVDENNDLLSPYTKLTIIDDGSPTFTDSFTDLYGHIWGRKPYDPKRIRNDRLPIMPWPFTVACAFITLGYAALHLAAWNIPLPTKAEHIIWRIASSVMTGSVFAWFGMDHLEQYLALRREKKGIPSTGRVVPWWRIPASIVVAVVYGLSRIYVIVESFAALRLMPASVYQQVDWGKWVPHI
jgi:hypothetical protein